MVGHSADFIVETTGQPKLGFSIEGPSKEQIECVMLMDQVLMDHVDGSSDVRYFPTEAGEYAVHITCDGQDIQDSPFMAIIQSNNPRILKEKCIAYGPGLENGVPVVGQPAEFTVNTSDCFTDASLKIYVNDSDGNDVNFKIVGDNGSYKCTYVPTKSIKHTVFVAVGNVNIPSSPWRIQVQENSHLHDIRFNEADVEVIGRKATEYFTVDGSDADQGDVSTGTKFKKFYPENNSLIQMTEMNQIGSGGFSRVYKGVFHGQDKAMKCIPLIEIKEHDSISDTILDLERNMSEYRTQIVAAGPNIVLPEACIWQRSSEKDDDGKWIAKNYLFFICPLYDCNLGELHGNYFDKFTEEIVSGIIHQCFIRTGSKIL